MTDQFPSPPAHAHLEEKVLRQLCSRRLSGKTRAELVLQLQPAHFREPANRIVYEEIRRLGQTAASQLREILPARVTNRGIPDFDFEALFSMDAISDKEIARSIRALHESWRPLEGGPGEH